MWMVDEWLFARVKDPPRGNTLFPGADFFYLAVPSAVFATSATTAF